MRIKTTLSILLALTASHGAHAAHLDIALTNLTQNIVFTPLLVVAHDSATHLFEVGQPASDNVQAMAEGGDLSGLVAQLDQTAAVMRVNPAEGPLMPAMTTMIEAWETGSQQYLSLAAMLLPTNDGFVGLDAWMIPATPGTYIVMLNGYDAGTEANDELVSATGGMPGNPGIPDAPLFEHGAQGLGVTATVTNATVHIHPGNLGDSDLMGGPSDLINNVHRWLNPVAKLVITVH